MPGLGASRAVYEVGIDEQPYQFLLNPKGSALVSLFRNARGDDLAASWRVAEVEVVERDNRRSLRACDIFAFHGGVPRLVFTVEGANALKDLLLESGELLPLISTKGLPLWVHNTKVVDCLDYERSDVKRFTSGRVMMVRRPVLRASLLPSFDLFRLPAGGAMAYASQNFLDRVQHYSLQGACFREIELV